MGKARPWQAGALFDGKVGGWLAEVRGRPVLPGPGVPYEARLHLLQRSNCPLAAPVILPLGQCVPMPDMRQREAGVASFACRPP